MTDLTPRLSLPLIHAGQAQKEMTHNEALAALDMLVQPCVAEAEANRPPDAPAPGASWIVGPEPEGAWAGQAGAIALWTEGGWRFAAPQEGMRAWCAADGADARFVAGAWRRGIVYARAVEIGGKAVLGPRRPGIPDPAGGGNADGEARLALAAVLAALRAHGLIEPE